MIKTLMVETKSPIQIENC